MLSSCSSACRKIGFRPETALIHLELAELLLDSFPEEEEEALSTWTSRLPEFREMKMQPYLARARSTRGCCMHEAFAGQRRTAQNRARRIRPYLVCHICGHEREAA